MMEQVKQILAEYTTVSEITLDSILTADLGLSSFDLAAIVTEFEEIFDIEISDRDIGRFISVGDILDYLKEYVS